MLFWLTKLFSVVGWKACALDNQIEDEVRTSVHVTRRAEEGTQLHFLSVSRIIWEEKYGHENKLEPKASEKAPCRGAIVDRDKMQNSCRAWTNFNSSEMRRRRHHRRLKRSKTLEGWTWTNFNSSKMRRRRRHQRVMRSNTLDDGRNRCRQFQRRPKLSQFLL